MLFSCIVGTEGNLHKMHLGRFQLDEWKQKSQSKGHVVVQEATQRESISAHDTV